MSEYIGATLANIQLCETGNSNVEVEPANARHSGVLLSVLLANRAVRVGVELTPANAKRLITEIHRSLEANL